MADTLETALRYISILRMIPREPDSKSAEIIKERLNNQGYDIHIRSIQRDLIKLSAYFPLVDTSKEGSKTKYWSWTESSSFYEFPRMDSMTAFTFSMVESYLKKIFPDEVLGYLAHHFKRANSLLSEIQSTSFVRWHEKVRVLDWGQPLLAPSIKKDVIEEVYQALMKEKQLFGIYRPKGSENPKEYYLNPLGIVFRRELIYLVCTINEYKDVRYLALHRFDSAEMKPNPRLVPEKFDLDDYIAKQEFGLIFKEEPILLEVLLTKWVASYLEESPLTEDQRLEEIEGGKVLLKATVKETADLKKWLMSIGDQVEVLKPDVLREEFAENAKNLAQMYNSNP